MRYLRIQLEEKNDGKKIILMFLTIFIVSTILAFLLDKGFFFTAKTVVKQDDIKINTNQKVTFYFLQLGYFNNKQNAENLVKTLNAKNITATYININGKYCVISWIDNIKDDLKIYENYLINLNLSYIIKNVELSINNNEYVDLLKAIIRQISLLKGKIQQEQLSIDNISNTQDDQVKRFYNEYILFMKNYKQGDISSCLNNLANEIFILKNLH
ncbi:MAG: SPOR domain-containing protein [Caloramator sp.]|nr:SPOR domain-containing protein [Caloramator sp.]